MCEHSQTRRGPFFGHRNQTLRTVKCGGKLVDYLCNFTFALFLVMETKKEEGTFDKLRTRVANEITQMICITCERCHAARGFSVHSAFAQIMITHHRRMRARESERVLGCVPPRRCLPRIDVRRRWSRARSLARPAGWGN